MTSQSKPDGHDHLLGIQSALVLLFDGLDALDLMYILPQVLPPELRLMHRTDSKAIREITLAITIEAKHILDKTEDGTGIGTLAVKDVANRAKLLLNLADRIAIIAGKKQR